MASSDDADDDDDTELLYASHACRAADRYLSSCLFVHYAATTPSLRLGASNKLTYYFQSSFSRAHFSAVVSTSPPSRSPGPWVGCVVSVILVSSFLPELVMSLHQHVGARPCTAAAWEAVNEKTFNAIISAADARRWTHKKHRVVNRGVITAARTPAFLETKMEAPSLTEHGTKHHHLCEAAGGYASRSILLTRSRRCVQKLWEGRDRIPLC